MKKIGWGKNPDNGQQLCLRYVNKGQSQADIICGGKKVGKKRVTVSHRKLVKALAGDMPRKLFLMKLMSNCLEFMAEG